MSTQARLKTSNTDERLASVTGHIALAKQTHVLLSTTLPACWNNFILAQMSCQLTPLPLCLTTRRLQGAGQYGRLHCTTKLSTEQVPSYLLTALNERECTVFFTTSCFVLTRVDSSFSQSRKKIPAKLWRHKRKLTFAMLERTCSTTGIKSQQRRMRYSIKQVLGSSAGREIITLSKETDLFWIRNPCTVHLETPVLSGCPQITTIKWLTHHGNAVLRWMGPRIARKIRKNMIRKSRTVLNH